VNGAHDLGGMHGFGPVAAEPEASEPVFHTEWERRAFALTMAAGGLGLWNIDMGRHARERQHPVDYLRHSYYENWIAGLATQLVETGLVSEEELRTGRAAGPAEAAVRERMLRPERVARVLAKGNPVEMAVEAAPRFGPGDRVRVVNTYTAGHTRAPRYVRDHTGAIHLHHGAHVFPDRSAAGERIGQHLYSVRFDAAELWGPSGAKGDAVFADLWEPYLEPA